MFGASTLQAKSVFVVAAIVIPWLICSEAAIAVAARSPSRLLVLVRASDDGRDRPVPNAEVQVLATGIDTPVVLRRRTDAEGHAAFEGLTRGYYSVEVAAVGFVRMSYGAQRPNMPGAAIALSDNEQRDVALRLVRGASIEGTVRRPDGHPAIGAAMSLLECRNDEGPENAVTADRAAADGALISTSTDQDGAYRFFGLPEGRYVIRAIFPEPEREALSGSSWRAVNFAPGTADLRDADVTSVTESQDVSGVDVSLKSTGGVTVSGEILGVRIPSRPVRVMLLPEGSIVHVTNVANGARFSLNGVEPGRYQVFARSVQSLDHVIPDDSAPAIWGRSVISVGPRGASDVQVMMQPSTAIAGIASFDRAATELKTSRLDEMSVVLTPVERISSISHVFRLTGRPDRTGTFTISGVTPGEYVVEVRSTAANDPAALHLTEARVDGADVLGVPMTLQADRNVEMRLGVTDATQEVSGEVQDAHGEPPIGDTVVLFSTDSSRWVRRTQWTRITGVATDGRYWFSDLLPGQYFLGVTERQSAGDADDPRFLARLAAASLRVDVPVGSRVVQNLRTAVGHWLRPASLLELSDPWPAGRTQLQ